MLLSDFMELEIPHNLLLLLTFRIGLVHLSSGNFKEMTYDLIHKYQQQDEQLQQKRTEKNLLLLLYQKSNIDIFTITPTSKRTIFQMIPMCRNDNPAFN